MLLRVYLNDWFYNMGVVGFMRILDLANRKYEKRENYIEFESSILEDFPDHYFEYLRTEIHEPIYKQRYVEPVEKLLSLVNSENIDRDEVYGLLSQVQDVAKNAKDKAGKISRKDLEDELNAIRDTLKSSKKNLKKAPDDAVADLRKSSERLLAILNDEDMKEKYYKDLIGVILQGFFGQVSFLNVSLSRLDLNGWKEKFYSDFILPVMEGLTHGHDSDKSKTKCALCGLYEAHRKLNFEESTFVPLGVSIAYSRNMFWGLTNRFPICALCRLMLFCTPAGVSRYYYRIKRNGQETRHDRYIFVNFDASVDELYKMNNDLKNSLTFENPFTDFILKMVEYTERRSAWTLENILFVEFNADYKSKQANIEYFHIPRYLANFFQNDGITLGKIGDYHFKLALTDAMLNNKSLTELINSALKNAIDERRSGWNTFHASMASALVNVYKLAVGKEVRKVKSEEVKKRLWAAFRSGQEMREYYIGSESENKIQGLAYRLTNAARAENRQLFMDTLLRMHMSAGKPVPGIFIEALSGGALRFEDVAHAYISGLISQTSNKEVEANG